MSAERRRSSRLTTSEQVVAILRKGRKKARARLVDQSAGGFQVALAGDPDFVAGDALLLCLNGSWFEVSVTRVERRTDETRLGLLRVSDVVSSDDLKTVRPRWGSLFPKLAACSIRGAGWAGFALACMFAVAIWFGKELIVAPFAPFTQNSSGSTLTNVRWPRFEQARAAPAAVTPGASRRQVDSTTTSTLMRNLFGVTAQPPADQVRFVDDKLTFLAAVNEPAIAGALRMSHQQRVAVEQLLATCRRNLAAAEMPGGELGPGALQALQTVHAQIRNVLTDQQRAALDRDLSRLNRR